MKPSSRPKIAQPALAALAGVATFLAPPSFAQQADPIAIEAEAPAAYAAGQVIVQFRPGTSAQARDQILAMVDGVYLRGLDMADAVLAQVPVGTEIAAAESLNVDPNVVHAETNALMRTDVAAE
jgi:hypothetical protein